MKRGFVIVATVDRKYLQSAILCADSIKYYWPEASITLFTNKEWVLDDWSNLFDNVLTCPDEYRAKLWALSRTPYDVTCYVDADMECMHEDVRTVFDQIGDKDMMMTKVRDYAASVVDVPGGKLDLHCGFFVYKNNERTRNLMDSWYEAYKDQVAGRVSGFSKKALSFDTLAFWRILGNHDVDIGIFEDDARWNFVYLYKKDEAKNPVIFYHRSL